jgi:hypothetical protein
LSTILKNIKINLKRIKSKVFTFCLRPFPTAITVALSTLPKAFSGICIPPLVVVSAAKR